MVFIKPGFVTNTHGVYNKGEQGGEPFSGNDDITPPWTKCVKNEAHCPYTGAEIDINIPFLHLRLD